MIIRNKIIFYLSIDSFVFPKLIKVSNGSIRIWGAVRLLEPAKSLSTSVSFLCTHSGSHQPMTVSVALGPPHQVVVHTELQYRYGFHLD